AQVADALDRESEARGDAGSAPPQALKRLLGKRVLARLRRLGRELVVERRRHQPALLQAAGERKQRCRIMRAQRQAFRAVPLRRLALRALLVEGVTAGGHDE